MRKQPRFLRYRHPDEDLPSYAKEELRVIRYLEQRVKALEREAVSHQLPHFQRHSETSRQAALDLYFRAGSLRDRVLRCLRDHPDGLTDEELQGILNMNPSTQRPRRIELCNAEPPLVKDSGRTRKTRSGRNAVVWVARPVQGG
jgi:hypothetical protein